MEKCLSRALQLRFLPRSSQKSQSPPSGSFWCSITGWMLGSAALHPLVPCQGRREIQQISSNSVLGQTSARGARWDFPKGGKSERGAALDPLGGKGVPKRNKMAQPGSCHCERKAVKTVSITALGKILCGTVEWGCFA